ncbi:MAG: diaminopimelate decarboxylase [Clostridia bacterium]|nr:diaminopimelate decarboxylase [Clostridia bacterium]
MAFIADNISVNAEGHLTFAGQDTTELAARFGTPVYLMDEERIRHNCRTYTEAFRKHFKEGSRVIYASKACSFKEMYRITKSEGMFTEVVSSGELATALAAGVPACDIVFHGSAKTDFDIRYGVESGVGIFAVDNRDELGALEAEAAKHGLVQNIIIRVTPGIDPHTYEAISTGKVDSKFGVAIETGQAEALAVEAAAMPHIGLVGFHCHVGSEVFGEDVFERTATVMLNFLAEMHHRHGITAKVLDLGGGYGVRYVESDPTLDIAEKIASVASVVKSECARLDFPEPEIWMEPGRSIAADAGMTLYTVGSRKDITGIKTYVAIDGGMADNPRYALYGARYTVLPASRANETCDMVCTLAGRCCESGDMIQENIKLPAGTKRGDIIAVCTTGAYNFSMSSNYNRLPRPAVVMLNAGTARVAVKAETFEDLYRLDV